MLVSVTHSPANGGRRAEMLYATFRIYSARHGYPKMALDRVRNRTTLTTNHYFDKICATCCPESKIISD